MEEKKEQSGKESKTIKRGKQRERQTEREREREKQGLMMTG